MMKNFLIVSSLLAIVAYFSAGCKKDDDGPEEFVIQVDSIQLPDTIAFGSVLEVDFYGLVGDNDCYGFSRFAQLESGAADPENSMRIQTLGIFQDNGNCQPANVYMNPVTLQVAGMLEGEFFLLVVQPNGNILTGTCYVNN